MALSPCRECGHRWQARQPAHPQVVYVQRRGPSGGIAAILSFLLPGLGQLYKGQIGRGILWFLATLIGYAMLIFPGLLIHLFCIINAMVTDPD